MRGKAQEAEKNRVKPNSIPITKIEAAFRQLKTAVILYFSDGDPVAVHTLAVAAHEILRQLAKRKGIKVGLDPSELVAAVPNKVTVDDAKAILSASAGFFKHAGRDPDDTTHFQPEVNEHFLNEAVTLYEQLTAERHSEFDKLRMIVTMRNPDLLPVGIDAEARARWASNAKVFKEISPANHRKVIDRAERVGYPPETK